MKTKNIINLLFAAFSITVLGSCAKEADNVLNMFEGVKVTFNQSDPKSVVDYKLINDKDEIWIDYTITSDKEDIYSVEVERTTPTGVERIVASPAPTNAQRRSFSAIQKYTLLRDGKTSFRVFARNQKGVYIGDGYKTVVVEQNPSHKLITDRVIYSPVTEGMPSFFSLRDGAVYTYSNGAANSANIDFGIWSRSDNNPTNPQLIYNLYSPSTPTNPFPTYDVSTWAPKRTTLFSAPVSSGTSTFNNVLISGSVIETQAKARPLNLTATAGNTPSTGLASGNLIYFLTPENKYGVMLIVASTVDNEKRPYLRVSVKMQN